MKKRTIFIMCCMMYLCTSCIALYSSGSQNSYYSDGIYYAPPKTNQSVVVVNSQNTQQVVPATQSVENLQVPPAVQTIQSPQVIQGYWIGGWYGSEADLQRAYNIIQSYPNGFGYMTNGADVAESMAFSSDWNVFVSNNRYWWFPTSSNIDFYTDFLFGPYPSAQLVFFDYAPYRWSVNVRFGRGVTVNYGWYDPWYYDSWYYNPWYYNPWHYDPWYHHHYTPHYGPHHGPHYNPHHGPHYDPYRPNHGPGYRPGHKPYPEHTRPKKDNGPQKAPGHSPKPDPHRPNQGKWRPTTTPGGGQIVRPGTTQRPSTGGGVVG